MVGQHDLSQSGGIFRWICFSAAMSYAKTAGSATRLLALHAHAGTASTSDVLAEIIHPNFPFPHHVTLTFTLLLLKLLLSRFATSTQPPSVVPPCLLPCFVGIHHKAHPLPIIWTLLLWDSLCSSSQASPNLTNLLSLRGPQRLFDIQNCKANTMILGC